MRSPPKSFVTHTRTDERKERVIKEKNNDQINSHIFIMKERNYYYYHRVMITYHKNEYCLNYIQYVYTYYVCYHQHHHHYHHLGNSYLKR